MSAYSQPENLTFYVESIKSEDFFCNAFSVIHSSLIRTLLLIRTFLPNREILGHFPLIRTSLSGHFYLIFTLSPSGPASVVHFLKFLLSQFFVTAPTCPPSAFHVTVLNCTSVRAEWNLPQFSCRNGFIRGYKLITQLPTGDEMVINISGNRTNEYIMNDLTPSTRYVMTILAYTVGDGPRSIHLTVETNPSSHCEYYGVWMLHS